MAFATDRTTTDSDYPCMIEEFFPDVAEYMRFLVGLKERKLTDKELTCQAALKKEGDKYLYTLTWKDGRYIGEYIRPFRANEQQLRIFNAGCAEMARRLQLYLDTEDEKSIASMPPAFGVISCESPEELTLPDAEPDELPTHRKYFPTVRDAKLVKRYDCDKYEILLLTDVKCAGGIRCTHLLIAIEKGQDEPSYAVAAEVNNLHMPGDSLGSHFLGSYPCSGHINHGCSDEWANLDKFDCKARTLMSDALSIVIEMPRT